VFRFLSFCPGISLFLGSFLVPTLFINPSGGPSRSGFYDCVAAARCRRPCIDTHFRTQKNSECLLRMSVRGGVVRSCSAPDASLHRAIHSNYRVFPQKLYIFLRKISDFLKIPPLAFPLTQVYTAFPAMSTTFFKISQKVVFSYFGSFHRIRSVKGRIFFVHPPKLYFYLQLWIRRKPPTMLPFSLVVILAINLPLHKNLNRFAHNFLPAKSVSSAAADTDIAVSIRLMFIMTTDLNPLNCRPFLARFLLKSAFRRRLRASPRGRVHRACAFGMARLS